MILSIIIVNWRSKDYLRECLRTVEGTCADLAPEIVVVDGASFDGCGEMLATEFPEVLFIQSEENIGFGQCNNLGVSHATGDTVMLLNPDTELKPGSVQDLAAALKGAPEVGLVGPRLLNSDHSLQTSCVLAFPTPLNQALGSNFLRFLFPRSKLWGGGEVFESTDPVVVEAVSGACMVLATDLYRRLGGFSPDYFMYCEDLDLCAQVSREGAKVLHVPSSEIIHHGSGSSSEQVSHFSTVLMRSANFIYMRRNHGVITSWVYRLLQFASAIMRLSLAVPFSFLPLSRVKNASRRTARKWWYVLQWSLGFDQVGSGIRQPKIIPPSSASALP
ncbi:MAG: glycosyltransferase [Verrucomicrobiaceae bacterium]|nr:glycosyltransferase [Verrucomicrobiaceae bacterium]